MKASRSTRGVSAGVDGFEHRLVANDHLEFVEAALARHGFSDAARDQLRLQVARIRSKCADPNLYLAVVGEFSSGKSTFINALLRDRLFDTSALPTTAVAARLRYGATLKVEARVGFPPQAMTKVEVEGAEVRPYIRTLTAERNPARDVLDVTITHPASFLANRVVVIDTPGINSLNEVHGEIARRVIAEEADAVVVAVPATMPLSRTLAAVLTNELRPHLSRCMFVATKMDEISLVDQENVLTYLSQRLAYKLETKMPVVYPCSAQAVMDRIDDDARLRPSMHVWDKRFAELESTLTDRLRRERDLSIAASVARLLDCLFEQLEEQLRVRWNAHKNRQAAIKREALPSLPFFAAEQRAMCKRMLKNIESTAAKRVVQLSNKRKNQAKGRAQKAVYEAETERALREMANTSSVHELLIETRKLFHGDVGSLMGRVAQDVDSAGRRLDNNFSGATKRLRVTEGQEEAARRTVLADGKSRGGAPDDTHRTARAQEDVLNEDDPSALGEVWDSGDLRFRTLDEGRRRLLAALMPVIDHYFDAAESEANKALSAYGEKSRYVLDERVTAHVAEYKGLFAAVARCQKEERERLTEAQKSVRADSAEIGRRRGAIDHQHKRVTEARPRWLDE